MDINENNEFVMSHFEKIDFETIDYLLKNRIEELESKIANKKYDILQIIDFSIMNNKVEEYLNIISKFEKNRPYSYLKSSYFSQALQAKSIYDKALATGEGDIKDLINTGIVPYFYLYAKNVKNAPILDLAQALVDYKFNDFYSGFYIYRFAKDIKDAPIDILADALIVLLSCYPKRTEEYIYLMAKDVKGAPINKLATALIDNKLTHYCYLFYRDVPNAPAELFDLIQKGSDIIDFLMNVPNAPKDKLFKQALKYCNIDQFTYLIKHVKDLPLKDCVNYFLEYPNKKFIHFVAIEEIKYEIYNGLYYLAKNNLELRSYYLESNNADLIKIVNDIKKQEYKEERKKYLQNDIQNIDLNALTNEEKNVLLNNLIKKDNYESIIKNKEYFQEIIKVYFEKSLLELPFIKYNDLYNQILINLLEKDLLDASYVANYVIENVNYAKTNDYKGILYALVNIYKFNPEEECLNNLIKIILDSKNLNVINLLMDYIPNINKEEITKGIANINNARIIYEYALKNPDVSKEVLIDGLQKCKSLLIYIYYFVRDIKGLSKENIESLCDTIIDNAKNREDYGILIRFVLNIPDAPIEKITNSIIEAYGQEEVDVTTIILLAMINRKAREIIMTTEGFSEIALDIKKDEDLLKAKKQEEYRKLNIKDMSREELENLVYELIDFDKQDKKLNPMNIYNLALNNKNLTIDEINALTDDLIFKTDDSLPYTYNKIFAITLFALNIKNAPIDKLSNGIISIDNKLGMILFCLLVHDEAIANVIDILYNNSSYKMLLILAKYNKTARMILNNYPEYQKIFSNLELENVELNSKLLTLEDLEILFNLLTEYDKDVTKEEEFKRILIKQN